MITLIFLIFIPFALWSSWKTIQRAKASSAWPGVTGTITAAERKKVLLRSQPRVTYSYAVNGKSFTGQRISFATAMPPKETDAILARYPVGQTVPVHYAPENPAEAVLEPGNNRNVSAQFRMLLICFVIVVIVNIVRFYFDSAAM